MKKVELKFPNDLTKLVGNSFGRKTYEKQVATQIVDNQLNEIITIEFPQRIDRVSSSFIQGFFDEPIKKFGIEGVKTKFDFISSIKDFKQFVIDNLE